MKRTLAVRCRNRVLNESVRVSVKKANAVCLELDKPEISRGIKGQVKGSTTSFRVLDTDPFTQ